MQNFVNFIKENYSYFVFAIEFIVIVVSSIIAFFHRSRGKKLRSQNLALRDVRNVVADKYSFLSYLPDWILQANILYPVHGDGQKRFDFVYQKALAHFGEEPSDFNRGFVLECINDILNCDKVEKVSHLNPVRDLCSICDRSSFCEHCEHWYFCEFFKPRDTQVDEPKKELYEKEKDVEIERSEDLRQDGEENESAERSACYVSRRN